MSTQILMIDPDINFMVSIKTALEGTGEFRVKVAPTLFAADEQLLHGSPDVAVVAFDLPDMDIMELLQHIRQIRPGLPLVVTPYGSLEHERAQLLGANEILGKPYGGRDLIPIVRAALNPAAYDSETPPVDLLEEFETLEQIQTGLLDDQTDDQIDDQEADDRDAARILRETLEQVQAEQEPAETRLLDETEEDDIPPTMVLPKDDHAQPTQQLDDTDDLAAGVAQNFDDAGAYDLDEDLIDEFYDSYDPYGDSAPAIERTDAPSPSDDDDDSFDQLAQTRPLPSRYDEPPFNEGDTPPVPDHDSAAMRTFLATDQSTVPPDDFGEALDAVGRARANETGEEDAPPDEFRDLVDSMRPAGPEARLSRLEELIQSLGSDIAEGDEPRTREAGVDFVLDAMRQGKSPLGSSAPLFELDDTTIGEVIDGLFEPSFEGVLAAMSGESVDEGAIQEPTYEADEHAAEDHERTADDKGADMPPTLPEEEILEPPVDEEDSRSYPATAALTALSAASGEDEDSGQRSLDALLDQIESQLPPARSHRPRLKPLPSWGKSELTTGAGKVAALFDYAEGVQQPPVQPARPDLDEPDLDEPDTDEPDISQDDTVPSQALIEAMDSVQDDKTRPVRPVLPNEAALEEVPSEDRVPSDGGIEYETKYYTGQDAEPDYAEPDYTEADYAEPDFEPESDEQLFDDEFAEDTHAETGPVDAADLTGEAIQPDEAVRPPEADHSEPPSDEFDTAFDVEFDTDMLTMEDLLAIADLPDDAGTEEIQREIMERAAAAARADREAESERPPTFGPEDTFDAETDEAAYYAHLASDAAKSIFPPDEDELVPLDSDTAAMIIETGASSVDDLDQYEDEEDESVLAAIAVQLTQFSLESSVRATMISRPGQRLAEAGNLSDAAMDHLFDVVEQAWTSTQTSDSLIRYITLPEAGEYLLYSTQVEHDLILSMVFHSTTSVRTIRKQARRLSESLELVPEDTESPAAKTLASRPTDMVPPEGWDEAVKQAQLVLDESIPVRPGHEEEVVYTAYTCVWLPADPALELLDDLADGLATWIEDIAADNAWDLDDLAIFPDYVLVSLHAPENVLPDNVITMLMDETARLSAEYFPDATNGGPFWTDGYFLVSPPRDLSDREIARFITYQRQAQLG